MDRTGSHFPAEDDFTDRVKKVMRLARQEAESFHHDHVGVEHVLLGIVREGRGVAANVLMNVGVDLQGARREVERVTKAGQSVGTSGPAFTPDVAVALELATQEARSIGHNFIGTEHLLIGLIGDAEGVAATVLTKLGVELGDLREEVLTFLCADAARPDS